MTLTIHEHPFAAYCWKALIALYERGVPFERRFVGDAADRERLAALWPFGSIPVLVDDAAGVTLPESTIVVEHLDRYGDAAPMVPEARDAALPVRLWDRVVDGQVMTPMQKIVADALREPERRDPQGVEEARAALDRAYAVLDARLAQGGPWLVGAAFSLADCAAAPALFYGRVVHAWDEDALAALTGYFAALTSRESVARVIDEARPFRELFPLPWPAHVV